MQEVQTTLPIGTIVRDRYVIEGLLGKGGFGAVYLVKDQRVKGNLFALKEMVDSSKQERARFAFECEVLKRLDHPALPRVYRVFEDDKNSRAYMLMDYIEGPNLETLRQKQPEKRFSLPQVMSIMTPVMEAVSYLHSQTPPIIHRDIKPANIIVPDTGDQAVLVDFGIAKEYDPESTTTAVRRCSPGYGAPEQYSRGTNTRTDVYGLGATFYSLLTGLVPEDAFYRMTQIGANDIDPLEPVSKFVPTIPPLVSEAIQRSMSINSNDRFSTVEEFWQAMNAYPIWQQVPSPIISPLTPVPPTNANVAFLQGQQQETHKKQRRLLLPILLIVIALALGLGVGAAYWSSIGNHQAAPARIPTSVVHQKATPTTKPSVSATSTAAPTATPTSVSGSYPSVAGTHTGSVHNTSVTPNVTANLSLSLQQNQGKITGNVKIDYPLVGSGSIYNGSLGTNKSIQFTVTKYNNNAPLLFRGVVNTDGSMAGQYCSIDSSGNCNPNAGGQGTWNVGPVSSPSGSSFTSPVFSFNQQANLKQQDEDVKTTIGW